MASFSNFFSVTESDTEETIGNSWGDFNETNVYNGVSTDDEKTWGDPVNENNGRLEFSKQYLYFTFNLERDSINEMPTPDKGVIAFSNSNGEFFRETFGKDNKAWMYTSQTNDVVDVLGSDNNMLVRIKIPTEAIYDAGEITKIYFYMHYSAHYGSDSEAYKTWDLENDSDVSILQSYQWNHTKGGKDYVTTGSEYSNRKIAPKLSYTGSVNIYSKIRGSNDETDCGKKYFTQKNGEIKIDINDLKYFSTLTRIPTDFLFEGLDDKDKPLNQWVKVADNELIDGNTSKVFFSEDIASFKKIEKVYLCFGRDKINKILCKTFENGFWNSDISDNVQIGFTRTVGTSNQIIKTPERTSGVNKHKLQSVVTGEFSLDSSYPFEFSQTDSASEISNPILQCISCDNKLTQDDEEINSDQYTMTNTSLKIAYAKEYEITEHLDENSNYKIDFLNKCPIKAGEYTIKCQVNNKLKTKLDSGIGSYTFTLSADKKIKVGADSEYLVFGGDFPSINFYIPNQGNEKIQVGGTIIIQNENLDFNFDLNATNFRIYTTNPSSDEEQYPKEKLKQSNYIGLHKDYHDEPITEKRTGDDLITSTTSTVSVSHGDISRWLGVPDEQQTFYISYIFSYNEKLIYTPPFKFTLGRIKKPVYDGLKVEDKTIKYFLTDSGCDQIISSDNKKFQNDFINERINNIGNEADFSMSRNIGDTHAKEKLQLFFCHGEEIFGDLSIKIKKDKSLTRQTSIPTPNTEFYLDEALELLKTGQINKINFKPLLTTLSNEGIDLISSPFDLKIVLKYMYTDTVDQTLFEIELKNINFSPEVIPIGLRKGGVIINPKDNGNEKLNKEDDKRKNTFVINVNDVQKTSNSYEEINGLKITFNIPKTDQTSGEITLEKKATFEIYLDEDGQIGFSNGKQTLSIFETIKAFSKIEAIQKHLNLSDEQLENLLSS